MLDTRWLAHRGGSAYVALRLGSDRSTVGEASVKLWKRGQWCIYNLGMTKVSVDRLVGNVLSRGCDEPVFLHCILKCQDNDLMIFLSGRPISSHFLSTQYTPLPSHRIIGFSTCRCTLPFLHAIGPIRAYEC
jgi:hypothetical protein